MTSRDRDKMLAFQMYAEDAEGMYFKIERTSSGSWRARDTSDYGYDPVCVRAVWRNFNQDWKIWH